MTANGTTTTAYYLVDDLNPTGYPQVVEELSGSGVVQRVYTYGLQRISENQIVNNAWTSSFYGYDGFWPVRQLTNSTGAITDTYDFDAFGNQVHSTGSTPNNYLYRGEQYDSDLGLYYLRARWMNPLTGRFMSRDPEDGVTTDPKTLQRYAYAGGDPVNLADPSGRYAQAGTMGGAEGEDAGLTSFAQQLVETAAPVIVTAETCLLLYESTKTVAEVAAGPFGQIIPGTFPCTVKPKRPNRDAAEDSQCLSVVQKEGHNEHPIAVGRRNYLFAGSDNGGQRAPILYSL